MFSYISHILAESFLLPKFCCFSRLGNSFFYCCWIYGIIYSNNNLLLRHINVHILYTRHLAKHSLDCTRATLKKGEAEPKAGEVEASFNLANQMQDSIAMFSPHTSWLLLKLPQALGSITERVSLGFR